MKSDSLVIIPTYNEKENISNIINAVLGVTEHQFDVLIVDDNSPDGTAAIVESMMPQWARENWTWSKRILSGISDSRRAIWPGFMLLTPKYRTFPERSSSSNAAATSSGSIRVSGR